MIRAALGAAAILLAAACATSPPPSPDLAITPLRSGVWMHTSWRPYGGTRVVSHGLIVREGDHLVLVDTAWGVELTEELLRRIRNELRLPVRSAVITHFHDDRLGGAAVLRREGIPFYAHPMTAQLAADDPEPLLLGEPGSHASFGSLEIFYPGAAHTRDNTIVWIPEQRVLFGGCAVRPAEAQDMGNVADGDLQAWPDSIRRILARFGSAEVVVPSHGPPGGRELLRHTLDLLSR